MNFIKWYFFLLFSLVTCDAQYVFLFKASALWADAFYKSKCPSVRVSVCPSVYLFTFEMPTSSHLKSFLEPSVPPIRLFLMINMMPLKRCVVKGNYFTALLRYEARNKFLMSGPWLSVAKLRPLSFAAARWRCLYLLL